MRAASSGPGVGRVGVGRERGARVPHRVAGPARGEQQLGQVQAEGYVVGAGRTAASRLASTASSMSLPSSVVAEL